LTNCYSRIYHRCRDAVKPSLADMRKATKTQREVKVGDVFDFSFAKKANEEIKASGWKP